MVSPPASTSLDEKKESTPEARPSSSLEKDKAALLAPPSLSPKTSRSDGAGSGLLMRGNASTPANIGGHDPERADSVHSLEAPGVGGNIGPDRRARRRRVRRNEDSTRNPRAYPAPRRANSLPAAPMTAAGPSPGKININLATLGKLLEPQQKLAPAPTWTTSATNIFKYSYLNLLLVFVPVSWACHFTHQEPTVIFVFSFLAIIPLAALLGFATEELALRVGQTLGGLLNATFGNAVELIIAILALVKGELRVVQASMLGSILSNCLLVLGMCFFAGGVRFHEQGYGIRAAQLNISLLCISVFSIVIPAAFHASLNSATRSGQTTGEASGQTAAIEEAHVLAISRGTSIILLIVYAAYLFFQLWTHAYIYTAEASAHHAQQTFEAGPDGPGAPPDQRVFHMPSLPSLPSIFHHSSSTSSTSSISSASTEEDETIPKLKPQATIVLLVLVTVLTGITAEWLVDSIDGMTSGGKITREFVALILLPLVGNAAEHVTAVTVSVKNKLDLAITVAVGSSIQIALFVLPFLILLGWIIGQPLTLFFDIFETVVVFVSVLIINYAISDGKTNWLEGLVLMVVYVIIGLSVWYYPGAVSNER
ncbi:Sodium/calcium exchanger protein [Ceratobasidium sp. AG-Ba]|nr:Sodium/calcium exchanger protein [Ceratobasidium sp. AG-Ba]